MKNTFEYTQAPNRKGNMSKMSGDKGVNDCSHQSMDVSYGAGHQGMKDMPKPGSMGMGGVTAGRNQPVMKSCPKPAEPSNMNGKWSGKVKL